MRAKHGTQRTVEGRWAAAALQVAQYANARFLAHARFNFLCDNGADTAQPRFAIRRLGRRRYELATLLPGAFCDDHNREVLALRLTRLNLLENAIEAERNFRDQ